MEYKEIIDKAKKCIDLGFDAMGREVNRSPLNIFLISSTIRAVLLTDAILLLCKNNFTDESLPLLRSLIETVVNMRWITNKDTEGRLEEYFKDLGKSEFGDRWCPDIYSRLKELGVKRSYYDEVIKFCHGYTHGNASSLPYGSIFPETTHRMKAEAIFSVTAQWLCDVLRVLDDAYKHFPYHKEIWDELLKKKRRGYKVIKALTRLMPSALKHGRKGKGTPKSGLKTYERGFIKDQTATRFSR